MAIRFSSRATPRSQAIRSCSRNSLSIPLRRLCQSLLIDMYQMVLVHPSVPANSLQQLVTLAKDKALNYGSYGNGSPPNLLFETLKAKMGVQIVQVPFRGAAPAVFATIA